jgi:hypothetical protein
MRKLIWATMAAALAVTAPAKADDPFLQEIVDFTGVAMYLEMGAPRTSPGTRWRLLPATADPATWTPSASAGW